MQVTPNVRIVPVPEEEPMRPQQTNIYIVGQGEVMSIDSGEAIDKFKWMLRGYLAAIEKSEIAIAGITHHHWDHSGNLKELHEVMKANVAVPENGVKLLKGRLPEAGVETLTDGQTITLDKAVRLQVIESPGHSVDSICYYLEDEGVLFTGDTLLGVGTTVIGDLASYRASLQRLVELPNLKVLCPGHGPLVHDARERLQFYIDHRNQREEQIVEILQRGEPVTSWEIMDEMYTDIDRRLRRAADGNVRTHLAQLKQEGRVRMTPGKRRPKNEERLKRAAEKMREERKLVREGEKLAKRHRSQASGRQENPPTEQWSKMPKFELRD
jgi:ribonuclease/clavin/mitogillin